MRVITGRNLSRVTIAAIQVLVILAGFSTSAFAATGFGQARRLKSIGTHRAAQPARVEATKPGKAAPAVWAKRELNPMTGNSFNGIEIQGGISFTYNSSLGTATMHADTIANNSSSATGSLRLELFATTPQHFGFNSGQTSFGYSLATYDFNALSSGFFYSPVDSGTVSFLTPPDGTYFITLILEQFVSGSGYVVEDWAEFTSPPTYTFGNGSSSGCNPGSFTLCVDDQPGDGRFEITVFYATSQGGGLSGYGNAIQLGSLGVNRGGLFWFFSSDNPEMLVKVVNGCGLNNRYWIFESAGTNVGFTLTVSDTITGEQEVYNNNDGVAAFPVQDTTVGLLCN